ncbi:polysaccharide deacetylase family protein [Marinobacter bohaiensis]|uniref:polysaccharide deacetylase family protein n=1 Tax=Marinobacter bohaiensis TaxID=2201898 RepID=UPI000DAC3305|nr:polysaccharide deacetylase family protein [Marinobacter bohaiensis]
MTVNQLIYKVSRPIGGLRLARFLARKHPRILMYHRISPHDEPGKIHVDQFRDQMRMIKRDFHPMNLTQLIEAHHSGTVPDHAVVVTFDDGYADFAEYAFPVLKEEGIPVTLFITTGFVNHDLWLWPDQVRYAIDKTARKGPVTLTGMDTSLDISSDRNQAWNAIADHCLTIPNDQKETLIANLFEQLDVARPAGPPPEYEGLNWLQVKSMVEEGLDIGSHSYSHPILTKLRQDALTTELELSRQLIREKLGVDAQVFCYPNGQPIDFNSEVKSAIQAAGYQVAVAAFPSRHPLADPWAINRYPANKLWDLFEKNLYGMTYLNNRNMA